MYRTLCIALSLSVFLVLAGAPALNATPFWQPIFEDELVASVGLGGEIWLVPAARESDLSAYAGTSASVHTLDALLDAIEGGGSSPTAVRFEGCHAAPAAAARLAAEGYSTVSSVTPQVPGSQYARRYAP